MGTRLTVSGQVQGVGFRPTVWRLAKEMGLTGDVKNTGEGVVIRLWGDATAKFPDRLHNELPPLARIERLYVEPLQEPAPTDFSISSSQEGEMRGNVTPDAATCLDCLEEIKSPFEHRYRYPFTNCTNCGPRFSIVQSAPYDRAKTTMAPFDLCEHCNDEYTDPTDRRFHAQPVACGRCGPNIWIEKMGKGAVNLEAFSMLDDVDATGGMILNGHIVAIRGLGGVHLACDATNGLAVAELRRRKSRAGKAFALMARDLDVVREYCEVSDAEADALSSPQAPIVLLRKKANSLPDEIAPGLDRLGVMLPYTPFYHLILRRLGRPVIMTSGNPSGQPQCIDNQETRNRLASIADFGCLHDRDIANRIDDSVVRVDLDRERVLRRARGYAPQPLTLPNGFSNQTELLALGSEQKNTFCFVKDGRAVVSQHMGDLEDLTTNTEVSKYLDVYQTLFDYCPKVIAVDTHPQYLSTQRGYEIAKDRPVIEIQHHHAHVASCLAENGRSLDAGHVLGIALDGTGLGDDGTIWGGEFLICDYHGYRRVGCLKPVALLGGAAAVKEPWRNLYAHLMAQMGWGELSMNFSDLEVVQRLKGLPRETLDAMMSSGMNAPLASSCGRLFDAAAALTGIGWNKQDYEGEAAILFEAALDKDALSEPDDLAYPFSIPLMDGTGMPYIEPLAVWRAMLGDLILKTPAGVMSARFHRGLAKAILDMALRLTKDTPVDTVALSGGCFQNAVLFKLVHQSLEKAGLTVLSHSQYPANDGGISLGQAVIALANTQGEKNICA